MEHNFGWRLRKSEHIKVVSGGHFGSDTDRQEYSHFGKGLGTGLGQYRPCKLKNKGPGGLSPRDKNQARMNKRLTLSLLH